MAGVSCTQCLAVVQIHLFLKKITLFSVVKAIALSSDVLAPFGSFSAPCLSFGVASRGNIPSYTVSG